MCPSQTFRQVWFTGCHSDIGGSYADAALSNLALRWIINEARGHAVGLRFVEAAESVQGDADGLAHDEAFQSPWWTLVGLSGRWQPPDAEMNPAVTARRGDRSVWKSLWSRPLFWWLLSANVALGWLPGIVLGCGAPNFWQRALLCLQYQAWLSRYLQRASAFSSIDARVATCLDFLLIPAYVSLFALLIVHARRGLQYSPQNRWAARLDRWFSGWPLLALVAVDIAEDVTTLTGLSPSAAPQGWIPWVAAMSATKLACLVFIAVYLVIVVSFSFRSSSPVA